MNYKDPNTKYHQGADGKIYIIKDGYGYETSLTEMPKDIPSGPRSRATHYKKQAAKNLVKQEMDTALKGRSAINRVKEARNMGSVEKAMIDAGEETSKLVSGFLDLGNMVDIGLASYLPDGARQKAQQWAYENMERRGQERAEADRYTQEFNQESGIPGGIGTILPYLASGFSTGPAMQKSAQKVLSAATKGIDKTAGAAVRQTGRAIEKAAPRNRLMQRLKTDVKDPLDTALKRRANRNVLKNPQYAGVTSRMLGDTALGVAEGTIHPDMSAFQGGVESALGSATGAFLKPRVARAHNYRSPSEKELIDWGKDQGMKFLPGMETGHMGKQMFEAGLRSDAAWADAVHLADEANRQVMRSKVYNAMGVGRTPMVRNKATGNPAFDFEIKQSNYPRKDYNKWKRDTQAMYGQDTKFRADESGVTTVMKDGQVVAEWKGNSGTLKETVPTKEIVYPAQGTRQLEVLTPTQLTEHRQNLKDTFDFLENNTKGKFNYTDLRDLRVKILQMKDSPRSNVKAAAKAADEVMQEFENMYKATQDPVTGKYQKAVFDGGKYQAIHHSLKKQMDDAAVAGRNIEYDLLKQQRQALENAMLNGINEHGGKASGEMWRQAREQYAITDLVMKKGMSPTGDIDFKGLTNNLMGKDSQRMLLESASPEMNDLYKVSKLNYMSSTQKGSPLTGHNMTGFKNNRKQSYTQRLLQTPAGDIMPVMPKTYLDVYASGYPSVTGLLNMGKGGLPEELIGKWWDHPGLYTRAAGMGTDIMPAEQVMNLMSAGYDKTNEAAQNFMDMFNENKK